MAGRRTQGLLRLQIINSISRAGTLCLTIRENDHQPRQLVADAGYAFVVTG
jgi:hypothetical protein